MLQPPSFVVISGAQVQAATSAREEEITRIVRTAYELHGAGLTVNPDSYFLRFPDRPSSRIIALPASIGGEADVHGIKWISSFPENVTSGLPRASAVLILNDTETGYPFACLEASIISASRTAASAALAAVELGARRQDPSDVGRPIRVGFFGTGLIARYIHTYLAGNGLIFSEVGVHDSVHEHAEGFRGYLARTEKGHITVHDSPEDLIRSSDLIVFATVAGEPHVTDPSWFSHNPLVLHISLRDLAPEIVLSSYNVVDDVEHSMKANTSLHLTEQRVGNRDFVVGSLYDVLRGRTTPPSDQPVVFSPFGLGVLDLAVARYVHEQLSATDNLHAIPDFFHDLNRYG
ncbi:2,3-diaminopropionate biosynthesis protein SbnB [Streptomyces sp. NPDC014889]|uniref:2,3-diaminopropionate biosynthesis protein SbnB n=1 Tax=Streptomyces sp. NPDC014889 TaxID=3364928 RepID=UPI0036FB5F87